MNPGFAFGDHIKTEKIKRRRYSTESLSFSIRGYLLLLSLFGIFFVIILKLIYLQLLQGSYYRKLSDSNRIRTKVVYASRGIIFDRNGVPLVLNVPGFRQTIRGKDSVVKTIHLSKEEALGLLIKGAKDVEVDSLRKYPYKDAFSHVLGYIGQISKSELQSQEYAGYMSNDWIGKTGIESRYEHLLRGKDGKQLVEVNAFGEEVRSLGQTDPIAGQDIKLTLDLKLQQATYLAAKDIKKGAVIVSKPNGEILAIVSKPSYDPNLFTLDSNYTVSSESAYNNISTILNDAQDQPLLNRVIGGLYPPGSTFKLIVAAAGLENKIIDGHYHITDTGILKVGDFTFANWFYTEYGRQESGDLNVVKAIARSNDIFFYKLAELVDVDPITKMAKKYGLGAITGIDLPGEESGTVPSKEWKKENFKENWYLGDTYHYGIGQGYLLTTPLQVNVWTQAMANRGKIYQPHLLKANNLNVKADKLLQDENFLLIRQGMIDACAPTGVAWPLFNFKVKNKDLIVDGKNFLEVPQATSSAIKNSYRGVSIACKTGTAEFGGEKTLPHAWITLFAPAYDPQIVVTVLSEESGEGSNIAAPVAKKILESYFSKD